MGNESKLQALVEQWKTINAHINKMDAEIGLTFTIMLSVFGTIITVFKGNLTPQNFADSKFWILVLLPTIIAAITGNLANNFRWVAIGRMYSAAIEREINELIGKDVYVWNTRVIDEFVANRNGNNTFLMPIVTVFFFIALAFYLNVEMFCSPLHWYIKYQYLVCVLFLLVSCSLPFWKNEEVRITKFEFDEIQKNRKRI